MVKKTPTKRATRSNSKKSRLNEEAITESFPLTPPESNLKSDQSAELFGLFLIAVSLVATISLFSDFFHSGKHNILGPYVGVWLARTLNTLTGSLPSILLVGAVILLGFKIIQQKTDEFQYKLPLVAGLLFLFSAILLSIKYISISAPNTQQLQVSGGILGNFIVQKALVPIFGPTTFGPYLITFLLVFFTVVWGFKLTIAQLIEKGMELLGIFLFPARDAFDILRLKSITRRKKLIKKWTGIDVDHIEPLPAISAPQPPVPELASSQEDVVQKKVKKRKKIASIPESVQDVAAAEKSKLGTNIEFRPYVEDEVDLSDPLAIRKKRDHEKEMKRIAELNDWEVKERDPKIAGLVVKQTGTSDDSIVPTSEITAGEDISVLVKDKESEAEPNPDIPINQSVKSPSNAPPPKSPDEEPVTEAEAAALAAAAKNAPPIEEEAPEPEPEIEYDDYAVPQIGDIFEPVPIQEVGYTPEVLKDQARVLEEQLANFKVMGKVVGICSGPVITRYEVELAPGVKVSQISGLSDDLAMALRAKSIRILAPIPGKSAVGIEVPNEKSQIVFIKDVLESEDFKPEPDTIKLVLGKDIAGDPQVMDLTRAPHLLIAGQTGSGKSVGINSFMASILCSKSPEEVRLILVDPKVVELKPYDEIPHLLAPVVTQPEVAIQALKWATIEMDKRYNLLAMAGVRNIKGYNQKFRKGELEGRVGKKNNKQLPYIVIVIDELADLMMVAGKEVETSIARIAQKARAVGLHLILATQRPSTNVITGTIKANLPTRVAFQVASQIDARTIMDKAGCEKLLGRGDMLFRSIDSPEPERIHGSFVSDEEAEIMAKACSGQFVNFPRITTFDLEEEGGLAEVDNRPRDAKFKDAAELVVSIRQASVSMLQRRMAIGYARAGRIMDQLERAGIVGRDRGSKPREVLLDETELRSFFENNY